MPAKPTTVKEYLDTLTPDERATVDAIRKAFLDNLDKGYEEGIQYGMIGYYVPHSVYPPGYHCDPKVALPFAAVAARKGSTSIYMHCVYGIDEERDRLIEEWKKTGKKLDMGKACIRCKKLEDIPLDVLGRAVKRLPLKKYIAAYEGLLAARVKPRASAKAAKPKAATTRKALKKTAKKAAKKG